MIFDIEVLDRLCDLHEQGKKIDIVIQTEEGITTVDGDVAIMEHFNDKESDYSVVIDIS